MKGIGLLALFACSASLQAFAITDSLSTNAKHYLSLDAGASGFAQRDYMVSPLVYEGTGIATQIGWLRTSSTTKTNVWFGFSKATLYNQKQAKQYNMEVEHITIGASRTKQLSALHFCKVKSYLGGELVYNSDFRTAAQFQNSTFTYNIAIHAAPVFMMERSFLLNKHSKKTPKKERMIVCNWQIAVPLFSALTRPNYNAIRKLRDTNTSTMKYLLRSEMLPNAALYFPNTYFEVHSSLSLEYGLKNGNRLGIVYQWHGAHFNKPNYVYGAVNSAIYVSFKVYLSS